MSGSSVTPGRDQQLLFIGQQCSDRSCQLVDFLPIKCQHCSQPFCADHYLPAAHRCDKYDEHQHNRVAPSCPLCNIPIAIPPGEDPNIRMERHFNYDCSVMTGKSGKAKSTPTCAKAKCGKVLFAPIPCEKCKEQFCPSHRFPVDHNCPSLISSSSPSSTSKLHSSRLPNVTSQTVAASSSAKAAIKRAIANVGSSTASSTAGHGITPSSASKPSSPSKASPRPNPFSKTDRPRTTVVTPTTTANLSDTTSSTTSAATTIHATTADTPPQQCSPKLPAKSSMNFSRAREERDSRMRAMQARARKGLLSEDEKLILASLEAERSKGGGRNKECIIM
ncbi:hypothetical protein EW146_g1182 [Bondarzewia mesenterica]|uniref:AN1-type domain-containing protein n=1 Tax=Bondarzewia mesenterica TaxID=1095465 RepID=A0A4S4MAU8_9AGAM|nr:hypothetical protein EW146_g1182 [Bondarzewia mesenterica]